MKLKFDKELAGHVPTLGLKDKDLDLSCLKCGRDVEETPCFICETTRRFIHRDCERELSHNKCRDLSKSEHMHINLVRIIK